MEKCPKPQNCILKKFQADRDPRLWLWCVLGPEQFHEFRKRFGGRRIWFPKEGVGLPCNCCPLRNKCIRRLHRRGNTVRDLSKRFAISRKQIYALL